MCRPPTIRASSRAADFPTLPAMPTRPPATRSRWMVKFHGGGTSAVAPLWAGLLALFNQSLGKAVGYLNPNLYQSIATKAGTFRDITSGNNGDYKAGPRDGTPAAAGAVRTARRCCRRCQHGHNTNAHPNTNANSHSKPPKPPRRHKTSAEAHYASPQPKPAASRSRSREPKRHRSAAANGRQMAFSHEPKKRHPSRDGVLPLMPL